jgi:hypothetical protein
MATAGSQPDGAGAKKIVAAALQTGVVALTCGTQGETAILRRWFELITQHREGLARVVSDGLAGETHQGPLISMG